MQKAIRMRERLLRTAVTAVLLLSVTAIAAKAEESQTEVRLNCVEDQAAAEDITGSREMFADEGPAGEDPSGEDPAGEEPAGEEPVGTESADLDEAIPVGEEIGIIDDMSFEEVLFEEQNEIFENDPALAAGYDETELTENLVEEIETEEDEWADPLSAGLEEEFQTEANESYAVPYSYETGEQLSITAVGSYHNWDGVTNAAQFQGPDGSLCFAVDSGSSVIIYRTDNGTRISGTVTLAKQHSLFGTAICDKDWNYYLVTGESNQTEDRNVETVFISKYDSNGGHIATVGDNGRSSLADYYNDGFATKVPFHAGNCDAAISGNILTVNYARTMYSNHQSNSVFSVNIANMTKVHIDSIYESHSFAQRVVPTSDGFVYVSEGDCYDRSFKINSLTLEDGVPKNITEYSIFDFWVEDGALDRYNMFVVNENFAHMGGLAALSNGMIAFAAQSVQSLNPNAANESEEIFIQIFDPRKPLDSADAYVTSGNRSGLAGPNGRTDTANYGVKWLTSYGNGYGISNVQVVSTDRKQIIVLYELSQDGDYKGVYYISLDESGNVIKPATLLSAKAMLNPCEMPVSSGGKISWVGNRYGDPANKIFLYSLDPSMDAVSVIDGVTEKTGLTYSGGSQELVNAGKVSGGSYVYALGEDSSTQPKEDRYSAAIPTASKVGTYYVWYKAVGDASHIDGDPFCVKVSIKKGLNALSLQGKTAKIKYSRLKKKKQSLAPEKAISFQNKGDGKLTYRLSSARKGKKSFKKYFAVNPKTGKITIKKGLKKGVYKVAIMVSSKETASYLAGSEKVIVKIRVK